MPTGFPVPQLQHLDCSVLHLIMAPIIILFFATLMRGDAISADSLLRTILLSGGALAAEAEFGLGW